jgi:hypothetical protein
MKLRYHSAPRPRWSLRSTFLAGLGIAGLVTVVVTVVLKASIWTELELITGILALFIFAFLATALYLGVRFDRRERFSIDWPKGSPTDLIEATGFVPGDTSGVFTEAGAEAGIVGIVIGFLLDVLVTIVLAYVISAVLWLGLNILLAAVLCISMPLFYFYRRVLRAIVAKGRTCRGKFAQSMLFALKSTIGYSLWFYTIFVLAQQVQKIHGP